MKKFVFATATLMAFVCLFTGCKNVDESGKSVVDLQDMEPPAKITMLTAYEGLPATEVSFENSFNIENKYYCYYFHLGTVANVPLYTSVAMQYLYDTKVTLTYSKLTSKSLQKSISEVSESIEMKSYTINAQIGVGWSILSAELSGQWTQSWNNTVTISHETEQAYLSQFSDGYQEEIEFSEDAGFIKGNYYRLSFYETVDAYGVLVYDVATGEYFAANDFFLKNNTTVRAWETSPTGIFKYERQQNLQFDADQAVEYVNNHPEAVPPPAPSTYYISSKVLSCRLDNHYNYDDPDPNANDLHYSHNFNFGDFVLSGGVKNEDKQNTFDLIYPYKINISFRLQYDSDALPTQDNMTSRYLSIDQKQSGFYKLPWEVGERNVKKGMIVILVEYQDGTPSDKICITNAFDGKKGGEMISIAENLNKPCKVSIAICYELVQWAPGFLGIVDDYWMNWRINQTFFIETP